MRDGKKYHPGREVLSLVRPLLPGASFVRDCFSGGLRVMLNPRFEDGRLRFSELRDDERAQG